MERALPEPLHRASWQCPGHGGGNSGRSLVCSPTCWGVRRQGYTFIGWCWPAWREPHLLCCEAGAP